jgi:hypothetical protein
VLARAAIVFIGSDHRVLTAARPIESIEIVGFASSKLRFLFGNCSTYQPHSAGDPNSGVILWTEVVTSQSSPQSSTVDDEYVGAEGDK